MRHYEPNECPTTVTFDVPYFDIALLTAAKTAVAVLWLDLQDRTTQ